MSIRQVYMRIEIVQDIAKEYRVSYTNIYRMNILTILFGTPGSRSSCSCGCSILLLVFTSVLFSVIIITTTGISVSGVRG